VNGELADKYIIPTNFHINTRRTVSSQKVVTKQRMTDTTFFRYPRLGPHSNSKMFGITETEFCMPDSPPVA